MYFLTEGAVPAFLVSLVSFVMSMLFFILIYDGIPLAPPVEIGVAAWRVPQGWRCDRAATDCWHAKSLHRGGGTAVTRSPKLGVRCNDVVKRALGWSTYTSGKRTRLLRA